MNIPNFLTLLRIILVPVFVIFLIQDQFLNATITFIVAALTDALDGFIARWLGQQTALGAYMDPIADKALMASSFVMLSVLHAVPGWLAVIVISRDVIILMGILVLSLMSVQVRIRPTMIGKITTTVQLVTVLTVLFDRSFPGTIPEAWVLVCFGLTAVFTVLSGLNYMTKGQKLFNDNTKK